MIMIALFKHAKNFVSKDEARPIFQGIHFDGENAVVTNTNVMVIHRNIPLPVKTIHFKTGKEITGQYPDYKRVIPEKFVSTVIYNDIGEFIKALKVGMSLGEKSDYGPIVSLLGTCLKSKFLNLNFAADLSGCVENDLNEEIFFNGKYLYDILNFFKDEGVAQVKIRFNSKIQPFLVVGSEDVFAVLTPVRVNVTD
jgi:DNA polymerase III sliding clamp (beta) subunit (PCNA family)